MRWVGALMLFGVGCGYSRPLDVPGGVDAEIDSPTFDQCEWQTGARHVDDPCRYPTEQRAWIVTGQVTLNTTDGVVSAGEQPNSYSQAQVGGSSNLRVVSVDSFAVAAGATLRVTGTLPLMIVSHSTIDVSGMIDVSSSRVAGLGPGVPGLACNQARDGAGDEIGGGGGGFGQAGGDGGNTPSGAGSPGRGGNSISRPSIVLGGCSGAKGGATAPPTATGGSGGGAIQMTSKTSILVSETGRIHAGGMGGQGGQNGGGGGGGSGGYIGLDAPLIDVVVGAELAANGGGGGTGCNDSALRGPNGVDGQLGTTPANGGAPIGCFQPAAGGRGGAAASGAGGDGGEDDNNSGGGGGGGVGFILYWGELSAAGTTSPPIVAGS